MELKEIPLHIRFIYLTSKFLYKNLAILDNLVLDSFKTIENATYNPANGPMLLGKFRVCASMLQIKNM